MAHGRSSNSNTSKFALHTFAGKPTKFFLVKREDLATQATVPVKKPSHHVLVVDRSGSMHADMPDIRSTIEKLLTLTEFNDPSLRVSLITYSSQGDVKLHFAKVTVADVMKTSSPYLAEIRAIRATAMTCISQGLAMAETLVDDKEMTCVTLHTDGFANDYSPTSESKAIQAVVTKLKTHANLFANTIAYRDYCDFGLLSSISNALSGVCIQARDIRQVYSAIYDTTKLLTGSLSPALEVGKGDADYVAFVSRSARKLLGSKDTMTVQGLAATDDKVAFRYFEISEDEYKAIPAPVAGDTSVEVAPIFAYCRTQISEGNLNIAKYAMVATRCGELLASHAKALVSSDVAAFAAAVEGYLFDLTSYKPTETYGLTSTGPSLLTVFSVLQKHHSSLSVNVKKMSASYKRRGIKKIPGTRQKDGSIQVPTVESRLRDPDGWASVGKFELNRNTATANMLLAQPIDLYSTGTNNRIASVSGVNLDLTNFNSYTLVGDGQLNLPALPMRTTDKRCFKDLKDIGLVSGEYTPGAEFDLDLSKLPLVDYDMNYNSGIDKGTLQDLAKMTVLSKILSELVKGESTSLTTQQVAELKAHHLSASLNFSPPTTNEYSDLADAMATGKVDTRLSYKINVGVPELTSVSKLKSGNEYLQRRFTLGVAGKAVEKATVGQLLTPKAKWDIKKLSSKTVLDAVDTLSYPIYEGVLGLGGGADVKTVLKVAGVTDPDTFLKTLHGGDKDAIVAAATDANIQVNKAIEGIYDRVRPLAFYVGATGLVPDSLNAKSMTAEQFATAYPNAKLSKDETEEGTFFVLPDGVVITVYVKGENFTRN